MRPEYSHILVNHDCHPKGILYQLVRTPEGETKNYMGIDDTIDYLCTTMYFDRYDIDGRVWHGKLAVQLMMMRMKLRYGE
jgi:hypothetical protein